MKSCMDCGRAFIQSGPMMRAVTDSRTDPLCPDCAQGGQPGRPREREGPTWSERCLRTFFHHAPDCMLVVDPCHANGPVVVDANGAACTRFDYTREEMVGLPWSALDAPETWPTDPEHARRVMSGEAVVFEAEQPCKDGSRVPIEVKARVFKIADKPYIYAIHRDITEQKRIEAELLRAQRTESFGVLAGGLAHDFNNLLTAILGSLSMLQAHPHAAEQKELLLADLHLATNRARQLTRQLLTFTKAGAPITRPICLRAIVADALPSALAGSGVTPHFVVEEDLPPVVADEAQMSDLVTALLDHATRAMPEGGVIRLSLERFDGSPDGSPNPVDMWVLLRVCDEGPGTDAADLTGIFDPYTPKKVGSGLALASVDNIVKHHRGHVQVDSVLGEGTTFRVYLPCAAEPASERPS